MAFIPNLNNDYKCLAPVSSFALIFKLPGKMITFSTHPITCFSAELVSQADNKKMRAAKKNILEYLRAGICRGPSD
jgi:hypothetical protein